MVGNSPLTKKHNGRAILFRGGALGDFILTIPFISYLVNKYDELILLSNPSYYSLIRDKYPKIIYRELDYGIDQIERKIRNSDVFSFWPDKDWKLKVLNAGSRKNYILPTRPEYNNHIIESIFSASQSPILGTDSFSFPYLGDHWIKTSTLWIHPGSGSSKKNMPLSFFLKIGRDWLIKKPENKVVFSFGEADESILADFQSQNIEYSDRVSQIIPKSVVEFKKLLMKGTACFWGNDSGPSHLAANLGIPTNVCFRVTNSGEWKPTGPRVKIYEFRKDSI
jgi:hypothetical protein